MRHFILPLIIAGILTSCSGSDDDTGNNGNAQDYFSLNEGKYWVYDTETSQSAGRDSLYTANDTVINNTTYTKFKTREMPTGFYSGALSGNGIRQSGSKLLVSGGTSLALSEEFPLSLSISDFTFFDSEATPGTTLATSSGTIEQPTEDGYSIEVDYTMTSVALDDIESHTLPNGITYNNIKKVMIKLNVGIKAIIIVENFEIPFEIMLPQDVLISTQYYAEGIGVIHVVTDINYSLQNLATLDIELPVPSSGSESQQEILVDYN